MAKKQQQQQVVVGSTWSNVNIDLDNLMGNKSSKGPAPTMNQMKSTTTSPVKSPTTPASAAANNANTNFAFNQSNNNNNFNQFNAFQ